MLMWIVTCPNCGTKNEVDKSQVVVECGLAHCSCTCQNCGKTFEETEEYWRWLGLDENPLQETW